MQRAVPSPFDKHDSLVQIVSANQKGDEPPFWTWFIENPPPAPKLASCGRAWSNFRRQAIANPDLCLNQPWEVGIWL